MPSDLFSQYCGRLYEVAFNSGMLTFLEQQEQAKMLTTMNIRSLYQPDLARLRFQPMVSYVLAQSKNIGPSPQLRKVAEQLLLHFCFKGYLQAHGSLKSGRKNEKLVHSGNERSPEH